MTQTGEAPQSRLVVALFGDRAIGWARRGDSHARDLKECNTRIQEAKETASSAPIHVADGDLLLREGIIRACLPNVTSVDAGNLPLDCADFITLLSPGLAASFS